MSNEVLAIPSPDFQSSQPMKENASSNDKNAETTAATSSSSLIDYSSPTRKTRIVRVRRNSMGVEIGRSYTDTTPGVTSSHDETDVNKIEERIPLSPLKPSFIQQLKRGWLSL